MPMIGHCNGARLIYPDYASAKRRFAFGGNFTVEWLTGADGSRSVTSSEELLMVMHAAGARIVGA
ncbi:MAG TPA: hypothetical protein VL100_13835, partial [Croceibacterium sp.]|nr:hypothetical protein [Croceibacterium sp.]